MGVLAGGGERALARHLEERTESLSHHQLRVRPAQALDHGIRRYSYSTPDARRGLPAHAKTLPSAERRRYLDHAVECPARTLTQQSVELTAIDGEGDFEGGRTTSSLFPHEVLLGLRDERARHVAHAILVSTSYLAEVVETALTDNPLRDRLRIYVKNLEFDVIDARYRDDLRRGVGRVVKTGGRMLDPDEARTIALTEIALLTGESATGLPSA